MNSDIIQFIVGQVGVAGIAYFALVMIERNFKEALRREQEMNQKLENLLGRVLTTLERNGELNSALLHSINDLSDRILYSESRTKPKTED